MCYIYSIRRNCEFEKNATFIRNSGADVDWWIAGIRDTMYARSETVLPCMARSEAVLLWAIEVLYNESRINIYI